MNEEKTTEHQETTESEKRKRQLEKIRQTFEPRPNEDRAKREQDFDRLSKELQRQFELRLQSDAAVDTKTGVILGFLMLIIIQITLSPGIIDTMTSHSLYTTISFYFGYAFILLAFAAGMYGFWIRKYEVGAEINHKSDKNPGMFQLWLSKEENHYPMSLFTKIAKAYQYNEEVFENKIKSLRAMLALFVAGFISIFISAILLRVT
jgi:hypothetical protein